MISSNKAFMSYSHAADGKLAPALQAALHQFAKPWYRLRAMRVFCDKTSLSANPALWPSIEAALGESEYFLLLASTEAAASPWVQKEIDWWLTNRSVEKMLIVLTDGELVWNASAGDFDWNRTTALASDLRGRFEDEPLYVDLSWAKTEDDLSLRHSQFRDAVLDIAAPLHGRAKDELGGDDVRQHRRTKRIGWSAVAGLTALTISSVVATYLAIQQRDLAEERSRIALSRQLAAQAVTHLDDELDLAMLLAVEAYRTRNTIEARNTLFTAVQHNPRLTTFLHGHTAGVLSLAFSPDGSTVASSGWDKTVRLWDVATGRPIGSPYAGHENYVHSVAFSPDGAMLASGSCARFVKGLCKEGEIRLIDVESQRLNGTPLLGHENWVYSVAFSPDGKLLASGSSDDTVRLWDTATGRPVGQPLSGHESWVVDVAFSPDGKLIASASWDDTIRLWDVASGRSIGSPLTGHENWLTVAFSPDGSMLASGGSDDQVRLWDVAARRPIGEPLAGHAHLVNEVAFSPDGKTFLSASRDRTIIQWDVASRLPIDPSLTGHSNEVLSVAISPDGGTVASGDRDGGIILWKLSNLKPLARSLATGIGPVSSIAFTPEGGLVSLEGKPLDGRNERLSSWDVSKAVPVSATEFKTSILRQAMSPDGRILATSARSKNRDGESTIALREVATGRPLGVPLKTKNGLVRGLAFNPKGSRLAAGNEDGTIVVWDVSTRRSSAPPLAGHAGIVESVTFSQDGRLLASGGNDGMVRLWDLGTRTALGDPLVGHTTQVTQVAFSPDGKTLTSSSVGKTSEENAITLWDVETRQPLGAPLGGQRVVMDLAFGPDGRLLVAGNGDGTISLFDLATRQQIGRPLAGHASSVNAVAFSPSGQWLASASGNIGAGLTLDPSGIPRDGEIVLWDVRVESWIDRACRRANRNLSPQEWTRFVGQDTARPTCPE